MIDTYWTALREKQFNDFQVHHDRQVINTGYSRQPLPAKGRGDLGPFGKEAF
jgi:hypothetical protein